MIASLIAAATYLAGVSLTHVFYEETYEYERSTAATATVVPVTIAILTYHEPLTAALALTPIFAGKARPVILGALTVFLPATLGIPYLLSQAPMGRPRWNAVTYTAAYLFVLLATL